jgi:hypothetical protein
MITHDKIQAGSIVQFQMDWGKEPTPSNTSIVIRVAKDRSWADVKTPFGTKRVPDPEKYLKLVKEPLVVRFK